MASSSHPASRRFYDYLKSLQEEFERQFDDTLSTKYSGSRRFNIYLGNLKGEFELMSLEIETLREEMDQYKGKVEMQMERLQDSDVGHNSVCERCSMDSRLTSTPKFFQFKSLNKLDTSRGIDLTLETTSRPPIATEHLIEKPHRIITSSRTSQSAYRTVDDGNEERECLIDFNNTFENLLDVELVHTLDHGKSIERVKFSRDGKYLATGCSDGKAYIYDVQAGTLTRVLRNLLAEKDSIEAVCFSHDGKYLVTGSWPGGELYVWEISTKYIRNSFKGHTRYILSLNFSPNGRLLVSTSGDNTVRVWNMRDGAAKLLAEENPTVLDDPCYTSAVFSPNGSCIVASHRDGIVRMWDIHTGQLLRRVKAHNWVSCVAFIPAGKGLVSGGDNKIKYWDVSSLDSKRFHGRSRTTENALSTLEQTGPEREFIGDDNDFVDFFALSSDGRWVASGSRDASTVRIWDTRNATTQCILNHGSKVWSVDFSPKGRYLASGGGDGTLKIWRYSKVGAGDRQ